MSQALIAVVDDDGLVRSATSSLLRSYGFRTSTFASAVDFLACDVAETACIVSDLHMPGMSGLDLHRVLQERAVSVPLVLMTAYSTPAAVAEAKAVGVAAFLEKPLDADALFAAIDEVLVR